jgi:hypothetical protein
MHNTIDIELTQKKIAQFPEVHNVIHDLWPLFGIPGGPSAGCFILVPPPFCDFDIFRSPTRFWYLSYGISIIVSMVWRRRGDVQRQLHLDEVLTGVPVW